MRPICLLLACAALSACSASAPVVEPLPPRPVVRSAEAPPPPPEPAPPPEVVPEEPPPPPVPTPRGTIQTRAYYEPVDVSEWVLTNGATVVFKPLATGRLDLLAVDCPASPVPETRTGPASDLAGLLQRSTISPSASATYVVVGDATRESVELAAAQALVLGVVPPAGDLNLWVRFPNSYQLALQPESDAVFAVLIEALRARPNGSQTKGTKRPCDETTWLQDGPDAGTLARFAPTAADVTAARSRVQSLLGSPQFWAEALATLYAPSGTLRPSRDPAFVAAFATRLARVSSQDVSALAVRLAASSSN